MGKKIELGRVLYTVVSGKGDKNGYIIRGFTLASGVVM